MEVKVEDTSVCEDRKSKVQETSQPDADDASSSSYSGSETKRLLTMAGLFDHWRAPKVRIPALSVLLSHYTLLSL